MKVNKVFKNKSISKQLTKSYILLLPFIVLLLLLVAIIGSMIAHNWMDKSLPAHAFDAEKLLNNGLDSHYVEEITKLGGGVSTVSEDGEVTNLSGSNIFLAAQLSTKEWTEFLTEVANPENKSIYSVAYDNENKLWLVVAIPSSIRLTSTLIINNNSPMLFNAIMFYVSLLTVLIILVVLLVFIYAKKVSKSFVLPLNIIRNKVHEITKGNYGEVDNEFNFKGEFAEVNYYINTLSLELQNEKKLKENIERERKQLFLDISHDIRNPLATIRGYSELLCEQNEISPIDSKQYLEIIYKNSIRASTMLDELFSYTKLESSDFIIEMQKGDISEFTRIQLSNFLHLFDRNEILAEINIPDHEIIVAFDKELLARVYSNLLCNCIEHNNFGITIRVSIIDEEEIVKIVVEDNGIGISEENSHQIFNPFFRVDESRNSKSGGCGLGLAIVEKIVYKHGGTINMKTAVNEGTSFEIILKK